MDKHTPFAAALVAALGLFTTPAAAQNPPQAGGAPPPAAAPAPNPAPPAAGGATSGSVAEDQRIAFVDLQRALNEVEDGKAAKASLESEFKQKQKILEEKKTDFDKARQDFEKQAVVMSEDARRDRQADLERKQFELQQLLMQLQKEFSEREGNLTRGIFDKMSAVVREIAEQDGITLVLRADTVVYAAQSLDITNDLVRKYNARHKPGAGGKPSAAGKPSASADKKGAPDKKGGKKK
jgi:outer membrane protein